MRLVFAAIIVVTLCSGCSFRSASGSGASAASTQFNEAHFSEEEKHKIYTAALAADESPLDSALFKEVCKKIGIFDAEGKPNDKYMVFVAEHVEWAMKPELELFRSEINTKEKAREYVNRQLAR